MKRWLVAVGIDLRRGWTWAWAGLAVFCLARVVAACRGPMHDADEAVYGLVALHVNAEIAVG